MRWVVLLLGFSVAQAAVADLNILRDTPAEFARAIEPRTFEFPRDHGPHPEFHNEWWYVTGNLDSDTGERFGFELTIFRVGLVPPSVAVPTGSAWRTREIYVAHFAITDVARKTFKFSDEYSRGALGLAGAQAQPFHVWLNDWELGPTIHARGQGYELTLDAGPLGEPVLNGDRGLSRKSAERGAASYYYSIPRITVSGKLVRDGVPLNVHGLAWLDREWGSSSLGAKQQGWDWFAFQLQDGSALMFYSLRNRDGSRDPNSAALFGMDTAGRWALVRRQSRQFADVGASGSAAGVAAEFMSVPTDPTRNATVAAALARNPSDRDAAARAARLSERVQDDETVEQVARTLLRRWGVVFWRLLAREADWLPPWRELLMCFRRLEARGEIRGGRFVAGFTGEQYAAPEAIGLLRDMRHKPHSNSYVSLSAADPLNLVGIVTPGARLPALISNRLLYRDGVPIALLAGGEVKFLVQLEPKEQWEAQNLLLRRHVPAVLSDFA